MTNKQVEHVWVVELITPSEGQYDGEIELLGVASSYKIAKKVIKKYIEKNELDYTSTIIENEDATFWETEDGTMFRVRKIKLLY